MDFKVCKRTTGLVFGSANPKVKIREVGIWGWEGFKKLREYSTRWDKRECRMVKDHLCDWWYASKANNFIATHANFQMWFEGIEGWKDAYEEMEPCEGSPIDIDVLPSFSYREGQKSFVEFLSTFPSPIRILPATMGAGKTASALVTLTKLKVKTLIIIPASLEAEWIGSIPKFTNLPEDRYGYVAGGASMLELWNTVKDGGEFPLDITVVSINTLQRFLSLHADLEDDMTVMEFFDRSGVGCRVVDEAHKCEHFHMLCSSLMNFAHNIFLTATLMKERDFPAMMENLIYPTSFRCKVPDPTNHVALKAYEYGWDCWIPDCEGMMGYMHSKYEKYILKNKTMCNSYMDMSIEINYNDYIKHRKDGDKALAFFSTTDMVTEFSSRLKSAYPDLNVITYGAGDKKEVLKTADFIVSTVKKAGTGTDVPQLRYVFQSIPISAKGENYQNVGRLRNLHGDSTTFAYLWCNNLGKQRAYHEKRQEELAPLTHSNENIKISYTLKGKKFKKK